MAEDEARTERSPETAPDTPEPAAMPKLQGGDIPWQAMEIIDAMPEIEVVIGFIQAQVNCVIITKGGFYGHYDGSVQKLPMKLVDTS